MDTANLPSPPDDDGKRRSEADAPRDPLTEVLAAFAALEFQNARVLGLIGQSARAGRSDLRALLFLAQHRGEVTPKQLAEHLLLSTGATTALVDRMASGNLVRRVPHQTDRRSVVVELGPEGRTAVDRVSTFYRQVFRDAVDPEDAATLAVRVRQIGDALLRRAGQQEMGAEAGR